VLGGLLLCLGGMLSTAEGNYEDRNQDLGRDFTAGLLKSIIRFERVIGRGGGGYCLVKERTVVSICHKKQQRQRHQRNTGSHWQLTGGMRCCRSGRESCI
jgi:hypothetical protein